MRQMTANLRSVLKPGRIVSQRMLNDLEFPHRVDVWKPAALALNLDLSAQDVNYTLHLAGQMCRFVSTPEVDEPAIQGRTKEINIFTLDVFLFPVGFPIADTWCLKWAADPDAPDMTGDMAGLFWVVQGNPQYQEANPFHLVEAQKVYAKLGPAPTGVS